MPAVVTDRAVLLVGHGSHRSPDSAFPVHAIADEIHHARPDLEVRVAFWKEEPLLHQAFDLVESSTVFVVPVFTSEGYFTESVLPRELGLRELGLDDEHRARGGRSVHYCPPVGTHPSMARIVLARAEEVGEGLEGGDRSLLVVGHGTDRNPDSAAATLEVVDQVRAHGRYTRVEAAFLDQDPTLEDVLGSMTRPSVPVLVVPFFISDGWHAGTTIPRDLEGAHDLESAPGAAGPAQIRYAQAVGTHPLMADVVLDIVSDALESSPPSGGRSFSTAEDSPTVPIGREAREAFIRWIRESSVSGRVFLATAVWEVEKGRFEIRHRDDRHVEPEGLATFEDPRDGGAIARTTEEGSYRPLSTTPDLRRGWRIVGLDERGVWEAYAGLYPTAPVHWHLGRRGSLPVVGFAEAAARQTGMYERVGSLGDGAVRDLSRELCERGCLRVPRWRPETLPLAGDDSSVPCFEPCSVFLSRAHEALDPSQGSG